ncbi:ZIP family metal transporter [Permianibacter aggregans]|uniref:ZIP family zinc transporter n=1 Tax=Permianibacter aggregans TaxID=1510150 RepID=A0A4R6UBS1_9GAMM|nr:ZIP family metal transporter [Permianibacter aggregans]QGX41810.1 ZIP family metal transporter [Permianibacter aggregans]TDQ43392.1 ZIP family zinc transporter [Permianibacter aggregans]
MEHTEPAPFSLRQAWIEEARKHPWTLASLGISTLAVLALFVVGLFRALAAYPDNHLADALYGGLAAFAATAFGAFLALGLRRLSQKLADGMLGFAAGMMLAASAFSLILPGIAAAEDITGSRLGAALTVVVGLTLGVMLMLGLDRFTPHEHEYVGKCGPGCERISRVWLFVFAITLHNLPEGMAIGVSFAGGDFSVGATVATAISIQDIPEGLAVAMALRTADLSAWQATLIGAATGLMEPLGALLGIGLAGGLPLAYPIGMGLSAGAMIFIVSHEVIPETHRHGHQTMATMGVMIGFAVMMVLDTALG